MQNIILLQTQLAMFFSSPLTRTDHLAYTLIDNIEELSDIVPSISHYPISQQPFMQSIVNIQGNNFNIAINPERMDLFYNRNINTQIDIKNKFISLSSKVIKSIPSHYSINRIGVSSTSFFEHYDADTYIKNNFLKGNFNNSKEFQIKMNTPSKYKNKEINNIINIYWGVLPKNKEYIHGMFYNRDINTVASQKILSIEYQIDFFKKFSTDFSDLSLKEENNE